MEIILAIVVVGAVILFGALISAGNERQRKAIDELREQTVLWAVQDLRIKREKLARDVKVDDPLAWLNKIAAKICGYPVSLQVIEAFQEPRALICMAGNSGRKVVFTPYSPDDIHRMSRERHGRLSQFAGRNPLFNLPRSTATYEMSGLNCGFLFDLELPLAWNGLTGQHTDQLDRLWMYGIP